MLDLPIRRGWRANWQVGALVVLVFTGAFLIPALGLPQPVTGALVNALLIIAVETGGLRLALGAGMITPLIGLLRGVLPLPLALMAPFIALSNALFVTLYALLIRRGRVLALLGASLGKFALLYLVTTWLTACPLRVAQGDALQPMILSDQFVAMLQWPQLFTALAGGVLAHALMRRGWPAR